MTPRTDREQPHGQSRRGGFLARWFVANSVISGILALCWVLLRSGSKPSRFAYPCQQAALSAATLAFGTPVVAFVLAARRRVLAGLRSPAGLVVAGIGLAATAGLWGYSTLADDIQPLGLTAPADYRAQVFHVEDCPQNPAGDRFLGLDNLITTMGQGGLKFYDSSTESPIAGPDGIVAADDVVIVKINYQWIDRGCTNADVLRGLLRRIVDHPDTFTGEIVVCENIQSGPHPVSNFDRSTENAQDTTLSPHDIGTGLEAEGFDVSLYDWTTVRYTPVDEYSEGDLTDGYVVYDYDSQLQGRLSYPKFQTDYGTYISLRDGIWDAGSQTYDRERLKFINLPVLKAHGAVYGITACVKHYMGVITTGLGTSSHTRMRYGLLGALIGEIGPADLNILDAIWVNADPDDGPWTSYGAATRLDALVASVDPVAADMWAAKNLLVPAFIATGHPPPWTGTVTPDPDDPASDFREYLDNSMSQMVAAGYPCTNDTAQIDAFTSYGGAGDYTGDGAVDLLDYDQFDLCFTGPDGGPVGEPCDIGDFDADTDVDCADWESFLAVWTDTDAPPEFVPCTEPQLVPAVSEWGLVVMSLILLCGLTTVIGRVEPTANRE